MKVRQPSLDDRYALDAGRALLSGTQALVRLLLVQHARDTAAGLNTAGFVSGYRGSPLGGLDQQLWRAQPHLDTAHIRFDPGVNEDLAATAVWGTQQVPLLSGAKYDGIFALWYGKGPGVDRSGDAIKHGNRMGSSAHGGVLLAFGDDHGGKSSTLAFQSDHALAANELPVLYPATAQECLELGLHGWALSRFSGLWVGFKCVNEMVETTSTVDLGAERVRICEPTDVVRPPGGLNGRFGFDPQGDDMRVARFRLPAAHAYARVNNLDRTHLESPGAIFGIVAAGKSYLDVREALQMLGIDAERAGALHLSIYKPGMIWPLEPTGLLRYARGKRELLFVEEKRAFMETQAARILYNLASDARPAISGKAAANGEPLLAADVQLEGTAVAIAIGARLQSLGLADAALRERVAALVRMREARAAAVAAATGSAVRSPYFCSGCPHNTSTRIPEHSLALSGIGCHTMAIFMNRNTLPPTHMGGEGMTWAGIAPFTEIPHVFQNLGDGTYFHSGLLAIRAAVNSGANLTYKILINDAVAMTGGQPVEGNPSVAEISRQLAAERVQRIAVVSDDPEKYRRDAGLAPGTTVHHRDELDTLQRELREVPGTTAILYEQTCAAEKRRRRKRGRYPDPPRRVFINQEVCEGCGDCTVQSNCVSIEPLETALGRKRRIDQSSCNKDYSCIKGFCPSFVVVEGGRVRRPESALPSDLLSSLSQPARAEAANVLIAGIGGSGVVTVGAILAMAAHIDGRQAAVFDMTGLAQKGGAVLSHLRIGGDDVASSPARLGTGGADLLLGCDLVVACGAEAMTAIAPGRSHAVINSHIVPTAQFQLDTDVEFHQAELAARMQSALGADLVRYVDAHALARTVLGDTLGVNMLMLGFALQQGLLPVTLAALERAIELNGTAVDYNLKALTLGRLAAHAPSEIRKLTAAMPNEVTELPDATLERLVADRSRRLAEYQSEAYAERYRAFVHQVAAASAARAPGRQGLAEAVARSYFKLLAYKDEYEVARLYASEDFRQSIAQQFEGNYRLKVLLAPPLLHARDARGEPRKLEFGQWVFRLFALLARLRFLRGTVFDLFGYTAERRLERRLVRDYEARIAKILNSLAATNYDACMRLAALPLEVRGFGHVKARQLATADATAAELLARLSNDVA
jgi:indolepyruvate ferredoxin oxidoreductase